MKCIQQPTPRHCTSCTYNPFFGHSSQLSETQPRYGGKLCYRNWSFVLQTHRHNFNYATHSRQREAATNEFRHRSLIFCQRLNQQLNYEVMHRANHMPCRSGLLMCTKVEYSLSTPWRQISGEVRAHLSSKLDEGQVRTTLFLENSTVT
jgi:hypothetical protein